MLSREWRCSWSSADRRCSNYIWVIDNFIAYYGVWYIRGFTVSLLCGSRYWLKKCTQWCGVTGRFVTRFNLWRGSGCVVVFRNIWRHYNGVIMSATASQITSVSRVYSYAYSGADQRQHLSSASLAFVRGIHRGVVNSPHKESVTRKMFLFDYVTMDKARLQPRVLLSASCECIMTTYIYTYVQLEIF